MRILSGQLIRLQTQDGPEQISQGIVEITDWRILVRALTAGRKKQESAALNASIFDGLERVIDLITPSICV